MVLSPEICCRGTTTTFLPKVLAFGALVRAPVRRQNIWRNLRRRLAEYRSRLWVNIRRRACGAASTEV